MIKKCLLAVISLLTVTMCGAQRYVLIDENMMAPVQYTDDVSLKKTYRNVFVVEADHLREFLSVLAKIANNLSYTRKNADLNTKIGNTKIISIPLVIKTEERLDVTISTHTIDVNVSMHLSDAKKPTHKTYFLSTAGLSTSTLI